MRRMTFLALAQLALPVAAARPMLILNEDNDHYFYQNRTNMSVQALEAYVDNFARGHVTHFFMCPSGQRPSYNSKVWEPIWAGCDPGDFRYPSGTTWAENCRYLHDQGIDPYEVWVRRCREKGVSPWITTRMNDTHFADIPNYFRTTTFVRRRSDLWRKPDWKRGDAWSLKALDYSKADARRWMLDLVHEQIGRWDADGIELDWLRGPENLTPGKEREQAHFLTDMVRIVRGWTLAAAQRRGHPVRLGVRVPVDPDMARAYGLDVVVWAKEGLLDLIVPEGGSFVTPVRKWREQIGLAGEHVFICPGIDNCFESSPGVRDAMNVAVYRGWADAQYLQGADGLYLFNLPYCPDSVTGTIFGEGLAPEHVRKSNRNYEVTHEELGPVGWRKESFLPLHAACGGEILLPVGTPSASGNVLVILGAREKYSDVIPKTMLNGMSANEVVHPFFNDETKVAFCFSASALSHDRNMLKVGSVPGSSAEWVRCELEVPAGPVRAAR